MSKINVVSRSPFCTVVGVICLLLLMSSQDVFAQQHRLADLKNARKVSNNILPDIEWTCGLTAGDVVESTFVPRAKNQSKATATINVNYGPGFNANPDARDAFQRAVDTWARHLDSPVEILIDATFETFENPAVLGGARPAYVLGDVNGEQLVVAVNILEAIRGDNVENFAPAAGHTSNDPEIFASFNEGRSDWHFGEGPPPAGAIDFESVILHEIGHGLQFASTFSYNTGSGSYSCNGGTGSACWGFGTGRPSTYDQQVVQYNPQTDTAVDMLSFQNDSPSLGDALTVDATEATTEQVRFSGELATGNASLTNGPQPPVLYAPSPWQGGSSLSHLDESTYAAGTENALMTPQIGSGELAREPGPVVCGSLRDMGWPLGPGCLEYIAAPLNLTISAQDLAQGTVELSWFVSSTADVASYTVERRAFDGPFQSIATLPGNAEPTFEDSGVGLGVYTYRLKYEKGNGETGAVEETPTARIGFTDIEGALERGDLVSTITLNWAVPTSTTGYEYVVERTTGAATVDSTFKPVGRVASATEFTDTGIYPATYKYRVRAVDGSGNSITSPSTTVDIEFKGDAFVTGPNPNPISSGMAEAQLVVSTDEAQDVTVGVYNTLGQKVYDERVSMRASSSKTLQIPVGNLGSGVYFVRVQGETFARTQRMAVTR